MLSPFFLRYGNSTESESGFRRCLASRSSSPPVTLMFRTTHLYSAPQMESRSGASAHVEFQAADEGDPVRALFLAESVGLLRR